MKNRSTILAALSAAITVAVILSLTGCWFDEEANIAKVQTAADVVAVANSTGTTGPYGLIASGGLNLLLLAMTYLSKRKTNQVQADIAMVQADIAMVKTAFGVVSRALDKSCAGEAGGLVNAEIQATAGATSDLLKGLHALAKDKEI